MPGLACWPHQARTRARMGRALTPPPGCRRGAPPPPCTRPAPCCARGRGLVAPVGSFSAHPLHRPHARTHMRSHHPSHPRWKSSVSASSLAALLDCAVEALLEPALSVGEGDRGVVLGGRVRAAAAAAAAAKGGTHTGAHSHLFSVSMVAPARRAWCGGVGCGFRRGQARAASCGAHTHACMHACTPCPLCTHSRR